MDIENRSKRPLSTQKLSNRDRELQRIKSLAVVSVLNKTFDQSTPLSSSSSTSTSMSRTRSESTSSSGSLKQKQSNTNLYQDIKPTTPSPRPINVAETKAGNNITREQLVSSPTDTEKESLLQKQLLELQSMYEDSIDKLKSTESRAEQQVQLILMQDKLVHELSDQIQQFQETAAISTRSSTQVSPDALEQAQEELAALKTEVLSFKPLKEEYEMLIVTLSRKLADSQARMEKMERAAVEIKKECTEQTQFIDTKLQVMMQQLQEKNKIIRRLESEKRNTEENEVSSARSSVYSQRKSFVAKWKGGVIPPAAPPPTLPLPPVPRPASFVQDSATALSIDAVGGGRRHSNFSEFETEMTDAEYYKEFTDQLQARLSISKEVDDLRLWEPSDFADIQRKIDSNSWFDDDHHSQKDQSAFWKGMKKKLRV